MGFATSLPHHDESEEEVLRRAIAMSLEEQEEGLPFRTGLKRFNNYVNKS